MPGGFNLAWAESLRPACRDSRLGLPILTCHHRERDIDSICVGFLNDQLREGIPSLSVRLAVIMERLQLPKRVNPALLSYEEMLVQMRADPDAVEIDVEQP